MTDKDILLRLMAGTLRVDPTSAEIHAYDVRKKQWTQLRVIRHTAPRKKIEYRFVAICHNGRQKKIAVHRLVWMAHSMRVVPRNYDIHHRRHDVLWPDGITNLKLLHQSVNRSRTKAKDVPF